MTESKTRKVFNDGKRAYTIRKDGRLFELAPGKSVVLELGYAEKLLKDYPRDLKDPETIGGGSDSRDEEIDRLKKELAELKTGKKPKAKKDEPKGEESKDEEADSEADLEDMK